MPSETPLPRATAREFALRMLKHRADRLSRLLRDDAPSLILSREAVLILKAAAMLDPEATGKALAKVLAFQSRVQIGLCVEDDCDGHVKSTDPDQRLCQQHIDYYQKLGEGMNEDEEATFTPQ